MTTSRDYAGFRAMTIVDPVELEQIEALRARLSLVPTAIARWDRVAKIRPQMRSQVAFDDGASQWRNLSHGVSHQLNHAADALNSLTVLIPPTGALTLPYVSHYAVARSALEAASLALWILAPEDPRLRLERHLRNAWREVCADAEMTAVAMKAAAADPSLGLGRMVDRGRKQTKTWKKKHVDQIRACARRIGIVDPTLSSHTVGFAEIVRDSTASVGMRGVFGEMVWREISGLSHPSMMRSMRSMDREELIDHGDGTLGALFTTNTAKAKAKAKAKYSVEAAYLAFTTAVDTFGRRKVVPGDPAEYMATPSRQ